MGPISYVSPPTRTTGDLITSAIWNQDVSANIIALSTAFLLPEHQSGVRYTQQGVGLDLTPIAFSQDRLHASPITIPATKTYDRIGVIPATNTRTMRLGIYADNAGAPGALVLDAGTMVSGASSGPETITIAQSLVGPGKYWLAVIIQTGVQSLGRYLTSDGFGGLVSSIESYSGVYKTQAFGALPNPFGAITTQLHGAPIVFLRAA